MCHRVTCLCLAVLLAVCVVSKLATGVCCFTVTRSTTPSARRRDATTPSHDVVINVAPTRGAPSHRRNGTVTVEVGPLVWNHERGTWVQVTEPTDTTPDNQDNKQNATAASIIIVPDLECEEYEVKDMNGVCREDWGRMMAPVNATGGVQCPQGQVADERGQCRGGRGRGAASTREPAGSGRGAASTREPAASGRGTSGGERRTCPTGQVMDQQGQCRQEWGRRNRAVHTEIVIVTK